MKKYLYLLCACALLLGLFFYSMQNKTLENDQSVSSNNQIEVQNNKKVLDENADKYVKRFTEELKKKNDIEFSTPYYSDATDGVKTTIKYKLRNNEQTASIHFLKNQNGELEGGVILSDDLNICGDILGCVLRATEISEADLQMIAQNITSSAQSYYCKSINNKITIDMREYDDPDLLTYCIIFFIS